MHFTPTGSPWLNLVERWFAELAAKRIPRGVHKSVQALEKDIRTWISTWNDDPKSYVWTNNADEILESLASYCRRINDSGPYSCDLLRRSCRSSGRCCRGSGRRPWSA